MTEGYYAWVGQSSHSCTFRNCRTEEEAKAWIKNVDNLRFMERVEGTKSGIIVRDFTECANQTCDNIHNNGRYCLKCEHIRDDARDMESEMRATREEEY